MFTACLSVSPTPTSTSAKLQSKCSSKDICQQNYNFDGRLFPLRPYVPCMASCTTFERELEIWNLSNAVLAGAVVVTFLALLPLTE